MAALSADFYSHAPRGALPEAAAQANGQIAISTHTPLAGRDTAACYSSQHYANFYSHAPRGARRGSRQQ